MTDFNPQQGYHHTAAFDKGYLQVDSIHELYYEQYGKENGLPGMIIPTKIDDWNSWKCF
jgi:hypothetical protein